MTLHRRALVVAPADPALVDPPEPADVLIAADAGVDLARALGLAVDLVVGDLDSASAAGIAWARAGGARIIEHPRDKDETDLELALQHAITMAGSVTVLADPAGRLDHLAANLAVLASPRWAEARLDAWMGRTHVVVIRRHRRLPVEPGRVVSLLAVGGPARGVSSTGLRFALSADVLEPTTARGVSNVVVDRPAELRVDDGVLLAIIPPGPSTGRVGDRG
ncbi:MAG: thiamine diphosphokinase, partial [Acidimicrobiales bacterium]